AVTTVPVDTGTAKFDLMLEVKPAGSGALDLSWEYATDVLDVRDAAEVAESFAQVAAALVEPGATVRSALSARPADLARLAALNDTARTWPEIDVSLFDRLADADPTAPAVLDGEVVTDRETLRTLRARVAGRLRAEGVRAGDVVALHLPRSAASVA